MLRASKILLHRGHKHAPPIQVIQNTREGNRIALWGLASNVILTGGKAFGMEAIHSASDMISDFITLLTFNKARKPKDDKFPYGYGRVETLGSIAVGGMLVGGGIGTGLHSLEMLMALSAGTAAQIDMHPIAFGLAASSVIAKEVLYRLTFRIGKKLNSDVMIANAQHHRSDALSSIVAVSAIGGSMIDPSLIFLDPIGGIVVAGMIAKMGIDTGIPALKELAEMSISKEVEQETREIASDVLLAERPKFHVQSVRARKMGHYHFIELLIASNDRDASLEEATIAAETLRSELVHHIDSVAEVIVHFAPLSKSGK